MWTATRSFWNVWLSLFHTVFESMSSNSVVVNGREMVRMDFWRRVGFSIQFSLLKWIPFNILLVLNYLSKFIPFLDLFHFQIYFKIYSLSKFHPFQIVLLPNVFPFPNLFPSHVYFHSKSSLSNFIPLSKCIPCQNVFPRLNVFPFKICPFPISYQ